MSTYIVYGKTNGSKLFFPVKSLKIYYYANMRSNVTT